MHKKGMQKRIKIKGLITQITLQNMAEKRIKCIPHWCEPRRSVSFKKAFP